MTVYQFPNAVQINNRTGQCLNLNFQISEAYKQLLSPSWVARNVPNGRISDGYTISICPNGSYVLGGGVCRTGGADQEMTVTIANYGTLTFNNSKYVHGEDIQQDVSWSGTANVGVDVNMPQDPNTWNFNHLDWTMWQLNFN